MALFNNQEGTTYEMLLKLQALADKKINLVGKTGKSAYQLAVENGFVGSEIEWLNSLNGKDKTSYNQNPYSFNVSQNPNATVPNNLDDKDFKIPVLPLSTGSESVSLGIDLSYILPYNEPVVPHQILISGAEFIVDRKDNTDTGYYVSSINTNTINSDYMEAGIPDGTYVSSFMSSIPEYRVSNLFSNDLLADIDNQPNSVDEKPLMNAYSVIGGVDSRIQNQTISLHSTCFDSLSANIYNNVTKFKNDLNLNEQITTPLNVSMSLITLKHEIIADGDGNQHTVYRCTDLTNVIFVDSVLIVRPYK